MCISPEGYGSIASTYFLGASARVPARKSSRFAQCSCQRGSMAFGSYLSCKELPSSALILARCSSAALAGRREPRHLPEPPGGDKELRVAGGGTSASSVSDSTSAGELLAGGSMRKAARA